LNEREVRLQKRKQANRDSARRSKLRKKEENEKMVVHSQELHERRNMLKRQLQAAYDKLSALTNHNLKLRQQLGAMGVQLTC